MSEASGAPVADRPVLAVKALSEGHARLRYHDTSLLIWQQQQQDLEKAPPTNYLSRSQSTWYSNYGNQAVVVRDKNTTEDRLGGQRDSGGSKICLIM